MNTSGPENCKYFYQETRKGFRQLKKEDYFITLTNFAISKFIFKKDRNLAFEYALNDCLNRKKIGNVSPNEIADLIPYDKEFRNSFRDEVSNICLFNSLLKPEYSYLKIKENFNLSAPTDAPASKTIYAIHLIEGELGTNAHKKISCDINCPLYLEITRTDGDQLFDKIDVLNFVMHVGIVYPLTVELLISGVAKFD
jgi:hypothetical protein